MKWDATTEDVLPMWIADMDFLAPPAVREAIKRRAEHGVFGYAMPPKAYYDAIISWFARRHAWTIARESIICTTGVLPAIAAALRSLILPGQQVLIQTPVYNCFFPLIRNSGAQIAESPLIYSNNTYAIDFADFERKASNSKTVAFLLCNPHNPAGRVWTREELMRLGEICLRHNVTIISDEIHCELVMPGYKFTPFARLSDEIAAHTIVCNSPTKNFNIAGLQVANVVVPNEALRLRVDRAINIHENCDLNPFGIDALIAAYNESGDWMDQLVDYLAENYRLLCDFCAKHLPEFPVTKLEGTYLVWINVSRINQSTSFIEQRLKDEYGLWINAGSLYGSEGFMRLNIACPRLLLEEGLQRLLGLRSLL